MNFKTTYILFAVLFVVVGVFALTQITHKKPPEDVAYVLPSLHDDKLEANDITSVQIQTFEPKYKPENLTLVRGDQGWHVEDPNVRADRTAVDQVIGDVMRAAREENGVDVTSDLKKYGLEPPAAVVTLKKGDRQWQLNLGDESVGKNNAVVYVTSSDRPKEVMAVRRSNLNALFTRETVATAKPGADDEVDRIKTLPDFRSRELLGAGVINLPDTVTQLTLQQAKASPLVLNKDDEGHWRFTEPNLGPADYDGERGSPGQDQAPSGVRDLLKDLSDLRVATSKDAKSTEGAPDFVADNVSDMAKYGLQEDQPATLKIGLTHTPAKLGQSSEAKEPVTETLLVGNKVDNKYYARLGGDKSVIKIEADKLNPILLAAKDPDVLRSRQLVLVEQSKIDAVDIQDTNGLIKLRQPEAGAWKVTSPQVKDERKADTQSVSGLLSMLTAKHQVQSFPNPADQAKYGFEQPGAVTAWIWENGLEKNESKDAKAAASTKLRDQQHPTVRLTFGKKDGPSVYVRREAGGETTFELVPAFVFDKVSQPAIAYLDRTLPTFGNGDVTKLVVERGGETFDMVKSDAKGAPGWKFDQPKDLAGRHADTHNVDQIIGDLRDLAADKLVAENPPQADLDKYGLKSPQVKATLTVKNDKKSENWSYLIGKETDDKTGYYAKEAAHGLVFVVRSPVAEALRAELQDPTVFHFNPEVVNEIKITGWRKAMGFNVTLDLQRHGTKAWTVKQPDGFDLGQEQADAFLAMLSDLRAERFVVRRTGPRPEFKLDDKDRNLHIEITVEGDKTPYTLTIGDLDAKDHAYYAESSTLKGDVFLLPQAQFEKIVDSGVRYFSKASQNLK